MAHQIIEWLNKNKEQMDEQGLKEIYIKQTDYTALILILKNEYIWDENYWRKTRELIRKYGVEYVSNYYENDDFFDIDEDYKIFEFF